MLAGRTGLSPRLIGRADVLDRLVAVLDSAAERTDDRPGVALVSGEAGVGKSRLLRELMARAPAGTVVLAGQAESDSLGRPFELAADVLGRPRPDPHDCCDHLPAIVDAFVERLAGRPGLLVFDDLHWADAESVAVFERLAQRPCRGLLVGSFRPEDLTRRHPAAEMLMRLDRRHHVERVWLDRLSRSEVATYLAAVFGRQLPAAVAGALHERTGGNPFFLEELLLADGHLDPDHLADRPLPWSLAELVARQLDDLSGDDRRVVEAAAVLGRRAGFEVLVAMVGVDEDELLTRIRRLVERGLLVEEADDEFSFRHALVRDAVEGQLLARDRRRLHALALDALPVHGRPDLAQLARHAAGAGRAEELVALARAGVDRYLELGSPYQAFALAVDALGEAPDDVVLLAGAARAAWRLGQHHEALEHAQAWYRVARVTGDVVQRAGALRSIGRTRFELGETEAMWAAVREAEGLLDALPSGEERARTKAFIAQINMLEHQAGAAVGWADHAIAEAEAVGAKDVRAQAMVERATALAFHPGRFDEAEPALREALGEAEALGDWVLVARALNNYFDVVAPTDPEVPLLLERLRRAGERAGLDVLGPASYVMHATSHAFDEADAAAARRWIDRVGELLPNLWPWMRVWHRESDVALLLEQGRVEQAAPLLAPDAWPEVASPGWVCLRHLFEVHLAQRLGDAAAGGAAFDAVARLLEPPDPVVRPDDLRGYDLLGYVVDLAEAALAVGVPAVEVRRRLVEPALARPLLPAQGAAVVGEAVEGLLAFADGNHDEAVERLGWALARPLPLPRYLVASLHLARGRALAALSRRGEALEEAHAALELLVRWPGWRRDEAEALVHRLDSSAGHGELTAREREVAALLAEGLTNAQLARRLYISPKTAAVHVSNILLKLGMANRAEVAAWAVRTGLTSRAESSPP